VEKLESGQALTWRTIGSWTSQDYVKVKVEKPNPLRVKVFLTNFSHFVG
jgi:hypothetical protein